jgi:hypothetical protein
MHFLQRLSVTIAAAAFAAAFSTAAVMARGFDPARMARSYSGDWPVTISGTGHGSFTGCLMLTGSGSASYTSGSEKLTGGSYFIVNNTLVATVPAQGYGQNAGLVFIGRADRSKIGAGAFDEVYGGSDFLSGALEFGAKGGC